MDCFQQPAFPLESTVDTTGAGDAFHGAFLFGLVHNYSLKKCAQFASAVAALNTQKLGGRSALPSFSETMRFLAERKLVLEAG
jgi:sugar/nucleoside kinase (ribokinase family)